MPQAWSRRLWSAAFLAALIVAAAASAQTADQPRKITVTGTPLTSFDNREPTRIRFGSLDFRGGLQLTSTEKLFGGLSGLLIARDGGSFVAISDRGQWFRGKLTYRDGRLAALTDVETAPMRGPDGAAYSSRARFDSEALTEHAGKYCIGVERQNEIVCFDYAKQGLLARGQTIPVPAVVKTFPNNQGLEAVVGVPAGQELAGALIAISERSLDSEGNIVAVMIDGPSAPAHSASSAPRIMTSAMRRYCRTATWFCWSGTFHCCAGSACASAAVCTRYPARRRRRWRDPDRSRSRLSARQYGGHRRASLSGGRDDHHAGLG